MKLEKFDGLDPKVDKACYFTNLSMIILVVFREKREKKRDQALRCLNMATVMFLNFKTRFNRHLHCCGSAAHGTLDFYHIRSAFSWSTLVVIVTNGLPL